MIKKLFLPLFLVMWHLSVVASGQNVIRFFWADGTFDVVSQYVYSRIAFVGTDVHFWGVDGSQAVYPMADLRALVFGDGMITGSSSPSVGQPLVRIYPNPAQDLLVLEGLGDGACICVYDLQGRLLLSRQATGTVQINVGNLSAGVYVLRINQQSINFIKR